MRSPPPIPPLRRELRIASTSEGLRIDDPALGRRHLLRGSLAGLAASITPHLGARPPSQSELARLVRRPRLDVQEAVAALLSRHLFDTPRARYLRAAVSLARARGVTPPSLFAGHPLLPRDAVAFRRAVRVPHLQPTLGDLVAAASHLVASIDAFERRFEASEVFATRDAFHIVRPDAEEAPLRLRRHVGEVGLAARALPEPLRAALGAFLGGGTAPGLVPSVPRTPRLEPILDGFGHRLLGAFVAGQSGRPPSDPEARLALRSFWTAHRLPLLELVVLQAPVFVGLGSPRVCPPWWPR